MLENDYTQQIVNKTVNKIIFGNIEHAIWKQKSVQKWRILLFTTVIIPTVITYHMLTLLII